MIGIMSDKSKNEHEWNNYDTLSSDTSTSVYGW